MPQEDKEKCPHLACLVYHKNGLCRCDMQRFCSECKQEKVKDIYILEWESFEKFIADVSNENSKFHEENTVGFKREYIESYLQKLLQSAREESYKKGYIQAGLDNIHQSNIGMLRQWLNEDRITDPKKMVTNEEIKHWLSL